MEREASRPLETTLNDPAIVGSDSNVIVAEAEVLLTMVRRSIDCREVLSSVMVREPEPATGVNGARDKLSWSVNGPNDPHARFNEYATLSCGP